MVSYIYFSTSLSFHLFPWKQKIPHLIKLFVNQAMPLITLVLFSNVVFTARRKSRMRKSKWQLHTMSWCDRGKACDSSSGMASLIGLDTKKIFAYGTRNQHCHTCKQAKRWQRPSKARLWKKIMCILQSLKGLGWHNFLSTVHIFMFVFSQSETFK